MLSGKSQASAQPTALGTLLQSSTYGATIPKIYGMTQSPMLPIWAADLRQGGSGKKFKQLKKDVTTFVENIDFLLGHNPIMYVNQLWINGATIPLEYTTAVIAAGSPFLSGSLPCAIQILNDAHPPSPIPDPLFYSVIGCSLLIDYDVTFDDYGAPGPVTFNDTYETPLWNMKQKGSDPNGTANFNYWPLVYEWEPTDGPNLGLGALGWWFGTKTSFKVYFTRMTEATFAGTHPEGPSEHNNLFFEPELGSGDEYGPEPGQQIIYPMFAGTGSSEMDLGSSGALPSITAEVIGAFGFYPNGDCDFADIIEDIMKSGISQAAIGAGDTADGHTAVEHGLSCYDLPGVIQKRSECDGEAFTVQPFAYPINVTKGNFLIAVGISGTPSISDSMSNTWTPVFGGSPGEQVWYAQANATGNCIITVAGTSTAWQIVILEVAGCDTFDGVATGISSVGIDTTGTQGFPEYLLNINLFSFTSPPVDPQIPGWATIISNNNFYIPFPANLSSALDTANVSTYVTILGKTVYAPGQYTVAQNTHYNSALPASSIILAFKCTNAPTYPKPVGQFMDQYSLNLVRQQCRAFGLHGALTMTSQQSASDWLEPLYDAADAAPIFCGFQLFSMPLSEVSFVGNGAVYTAPTSAGPFFNLTTENGDFLASGNDSPVNLVTADRTNQPNVLQMQCINRTSNYNQSVVEQPDAVGISLFGVRKADPIVNAAVQDVAIARQLLAIQVRKLQYGGDVYTFTLPARWCLLAPMGAGGGGTSDAVITVTDPLASIFNIPVRITSITENADMSLSCEAEPFIYGMYAPTLSDSIATTTQPLPYTPGINVAVPSQINPPLIFEATPRLAKQTSPAQIWIAVSSAGPNYGGCIPYLSTDGGLSYNPVSQTAIRGVAQQGLVADDWPSAADPDTTNNLTIDFSLTLGSGGSDLPSYSATARDNFQYPAYVGWNPLTGANAVFTAGDSAQITELDVLFSNPTYVTALPADATILNIYPMIFLGTDAVSGSPVVTQALYGTGMTPTTGGSTLLGPYTGPQGETVTDGTVIIGSLTGAGIRYRLNLPTTGAAACTGKVLNAGWAVLYSSATPNVDPSALIPFEAGAGDGWGWATPGTKTIGQIGTGSNGTIAAFGGVPPAGLGYELISYNATTMILSDLWEIDATGSGNEIRRGVYGAPSPGTGMDHPPGSPFALLDPSDAGLVKINMDPAWIGTQLWFKFIPLNESFGTTDNLDDVEAFPFTPTGLAGNQGPSTGGILVNGS